jgi:hypothetical protein
VPGATIALVEDFARGSLNLLERCRALGRTDGAGFLSLELEPADFSLARAAWVPEGAALLAFAPGHAVSETIFVPRPETEDAGECVLRVDPPGLSVLGRVLDPDGRPIAGASVTVGDPSSSMHERSDGRFARRMAIGTRTGADGRFVLDFLASGRQRRFVEAQGWMHASSWVELAVATQPSWEIALKRGASVVGRVVGPDELPLPGVRVWSEGPGANDPEVFAISDARGGYRLEGLRRGRLWLWAQYPDRPELVAHTELVAVEGESSPWDARLDPGAGVRLRLEDSAGQPLPERIVRLELGGPSPGRTLVSDEQGRVAGFAVRKAALRVEVYDDLAQWEGPRFPRATLASVTPGPEERVIVLGRENLPGSWSGTVLGPDGLPPPGAMLWIEVVASSPGHRIPIDPNTGTFTVEGLPPGPYNLEVQCSNRGRVELGEHELLAGDHADLGLLNLPAHGRVSIDWSAFDPVPDYFWILQHLSRHGDGQGIIIHEGRIESLTDEPFELMPGPYILTVARGEHIADPRPFEVVEDEAIRIAAQR